MNIPEIPSSPAGPAFYALGGVRVVVAAAALGPVAPVQVAATVAGRPAVVILLRRDVQFAVALSVVLGGSALLLAPWRRKRVVGIAVRHGHVVGVVLVFAVGTLPWGVVVRPLWDQGTLLTTLTKLPSSEPAAGTSDRSG